MGFTKDLSGNSLVEPLSWENGDSEHRADEKNRFFFDFFP